MMRRIILIVPDWLAEPGGESVLRQPLPGLSRVTEIGRVRKLSPVRDAAVPEATYLGMNPREVHLAQGPLTVSALGFDPPERSVHFHASLLSLDDQGVLRGIEHRLPEGLATLIIGRLKRLDTSRLTLLEGFDVDHGLVWEDGSTDMCCKTADEVQTQSLDKSFPEGDGEVILRRYIDDSINLLSEEEFNLRRIDEGLQPVNILWPWGPGFRFPVPNLLLKTGPVYVESPSLRLAGLTRLVRYKHSHVQSFGEGTAIRFESLVKSALNQDCTILFIPNLSAYRNSERLEELDWLTREMDRRLILPLAEEMAMGELRLTMLAPSTDLDSKHPGLMVQAESHRSEQNVYPFDERSLDERLISSQDVWEAVVEGIRWVNQS